VRACYAASKVAWQNKYSKVRTTPHKAHTQVCPHTHKPFAAAVIALMIALHNPIQVPIVTHAWGGRLAASDALLTRDLNHAIVNLTKGQPSNQGAQKPSSSGPAFAVTMRGPRVCEGGKWARTSHAQAYNRPSGNTRLLRTNEIEV
jgi:hypothetical protein